MLEPQRERREVVPRPSTSSGCRQVGTGCRHVGAECRYTWIQSVGTRGYRVPVRDRDMLRLYQSVEADIAAVFSETVEGTVEIGFRARPGFDVSRLALALGGGGHPQASGCTVDGPLAAAQARVVPMLVALAMGGPVRNG